MEKAEKNIDKARIMMQKSRCKWCCLLIVAVLVIVMGVIIYLTTIK
jgi:t-SNARE complex subunit (syntaxin)